VDNLEAVLCRALAAGARAETKIRSSSSDPSGRGLCLIEFLDRGSDEIADPVS
jgi:hypothetical protein